jgi:hypothetical protein
MSTQYSELEIGMAKAILELPPRRLARKLAKIAEGFTTLDDQPATPEMIEDNLRYVLAQQTPRGPSSYRPSLDQQLADEETAKRQRANALGRLPYGKGFGGPK